MKFFRVVIATFASNMLVLFFGLLTTAVTARWLGTDAKGILGISGSVVALFLIILDLGIGVSNTYFIAKYKDKINYILGCNVIIILFESIVVVIFFLIRQLFGTNIILSFLFKGLTVPDLVITLVTFPLSSLKTCMIYILLGLQSYRQYNKLNIFSQAFYTVVLFLLLLISKSVFLALLANDLAIAVTIAYVVILLYKKGYRISFSSLIFLKMIRYGIKAQLSNLVQFITYNLDMFIINYYISEAAAGCYFQAVTIANLMWQIPGTIATILYPVISNSEEKEYIQTATNKTVRISILFVVILSIMLALLSRPVVLALCGSQFEPSVSALVLLIPGIAIFSVSKILASSIAGMGRTDINLNISVIVSVLTVLLDFSVIPIYGINGAAIITSITYSIHTLLTIFCYKKLTGSKLCKILIFQKTDLQNIRTALIKKFR